MPKLKGMITLHTAILTVVLLLQLTGALDGLKRAINSSIPLVEGSLINVLTAFGGDAFLIPFMAFIVFLDLRKGKLSKKTFALILSSFVGLILLSFLKVVLAEPRPGPLPGANFLSEGAFPSGHTFRAAIIASYVSDRWKKLAPLAWAYAVGIAFTRLLLHYHWFSDALFSLLFAPWLYYLIRESLGRNEVT